MERPPLPDPRPSWTDTTPRPERPALAPPEPPAGGDALERALTALAGLILAALILRLFLPL